MNKTGRALLTLILSCALPMVIAGVARAEDAAVANTPAKKSVMKEVQGKLVHADRRAISVEYALKAGKAAEVLLPIGDETTLDHVSTYENLKPGDLVRVKYRQVYTDGKNGERVIVQTLATHISLIRPATAHALRSTQ